MLTSIALLRDHRPLTPSAEGGPQDPVVAALAEGRFAEEPALELLSRWMPRGGVFVDIGAHVGNHTFFMLVHGGAGRAIPFEFAEVALIRFRERLKQSGLTERVETAHLGFGLAEERGKRAARGPRRIPYQLRLKSDFDEQVRVRSGDSLLKDEPVDLIKIDVTGEEREVLKGLRKTLKRMAPLIGIDLSHPQSVKVAPFLARLFYQEAERVEWVA